MPRANWFRRRSPKAEPALPGMTGGGAARLTGSSGKRNYSLTDAVLIGIGVGLTAASATFPWYVFYHREQFGPTPITFDSARLDSDLSGPFYTPRVQWTPTPLTDEEIASLPVDLAPTGTVGSIKSPPALDGDGQAQPFPAAVPNFRLVHVANGRAMIRDDNGFFVVQRGSVLPDNTRVVSIENQNGKWLLRTSDNMVVELVP